MTNKDYLSLRIAKNLREFASRKRSAAAIERAQSAIADTIGVTIAGAAHSGVAILRETIQTQSDGPASLIGQSGKASVLDAALINGTASHMLDFDDSNSDLFGHLSVAILPSLLALSEREQVSGEDFIAAYLAGYEAGCRFGNAFSAYQYTHGWHPTTSVGIFGATAACAVLLGLDDEQTAMAFGLTTHMASGIKSNFGSMTKPLGVGNANRNAVMAVLLAQNGMTSGRRSFEHHHGYFAVYNNGTDNVDVAPLENPWDGEEKILDMSKGVKQKRFPCCFAIAPVLDCVLELRAQHNLDANNVASVAAKVHPVRFPHINVPEPVDALGAKFSTNYCVARVLQTGIVGISDFEDDARLNAQETQSLMRKITLATYEREQLSGADVVVTTTDGRTLSASVDSARGATYQNPLTADMVRGKFIDAVTRTLGTQAAETLWERMSAMPDCADIRELTALMQPRAQSNNERRHLRG